MDTRCANEKADAIDFGIAVRTSGTIIISIAEPPESHQLLRIPRFARDNSQITEPLLRCCASFLSQVEAETIVKQQQSRRTCARDSIVILESRKKERSRNRVALMLCEFAEKAATATATTTVAEAVADVRKRGRRDGTRCLQQCLATNRDGGVKKDTRTAHRLAVRGRRDRGLGNRRPSRRKKKHGHGQWCAARPSLPH